jgi:hypothetical protein
MSINPTKIPSPIKSGQHQLSAGQLNQMTNLAKSCRIASINPPHNIMSTPNGQHIIIKQPINQPIDVTTDPISVSVDSVAGEYSINVDMKILYDIQPFTTAYFPGSQAAQAIRGAIPINSDVEGKFSKTLTFDLPSANKVNVIYLYITSTGFFPSPSLKWDEDTSTYASGIYSPATSASVVPADSGTTNAQLVNLGNTISLCFLVVDENGSYTIVNDVHQVNSTGILPMNSLEGHIFGMPNLFLNGSSAQLRVASSNIGSAVSLSVSSITTLYIDSTGSLAASTSWVSSLGPRIAVVTTDASGNVTNIQHYYTEYYKAIHTALNRIKTNTTSGSFTTADAKTVTVTNGLITSIV